MKYIFTLIGETANTTLIGMLLKALAELLRLKIGLSGTFKHIPWDKIKHTLTSTWLMGLFYFLEDNNILQHDPLPHPQKQREGYIFLMQRFILDKPTTK